MNRPVGVTVIAVLCFIAAAFSLLGGILFMLGGGFMATVLSQSGQANAAGAGILGAMGAAVGVVILFFGVVYAIVGWGLLQLKGWARIVTIVLSVLCALLQLPGLFAGLAHFNPFSLFLTVLFLAFYAWVIWYLLQPNVSAAFNAGQARTASA